MFNKTYTTRNDKSNDTANKQFATDPGISKGLNDIFEKVSEKINLFSATDNSKLKYKQISELVDYVNSLEIHEIRMLMTNSHEIIRSVAAKAYVYKTDNDRINSLSQMLDNKNIYLMDSAIIALNYINSPEGLDLLEKAANTSFISIKKRALTGIADIAADHSSEKAREILKKFANDQNSEIRELVFEELKVLDIFENKENLTIQELYSL